ncbi:DUF2889 domain-containing protein [Frankia sp. AiPs1]|uniref:DUF2889 domain-containing protein n=1 Tax=Frankia sp. AiPa1 TaxID=573492 RepID=UPI00202B4069|nr:DUF2889 domain-containing protein [Frankia sp. AiPa1]MCL9762590.1 DUF2889 domain-containing protein [Frankia sp. AiPa1]
MHPRRGIHNPSSGTPPRHPLSVRRTLTLETRYPGGLRGGIQVRGLGRDLVTRADGSIIVAAEETLTLEIEEFGRRTVAAVHTTPPVPELAGLVGARTSGGFRTRLAEVAPRLADTHPVLAALLDDLPVAVLVSGMARLDAPPSPAPSAASPNALVPAASPASAAPTGSVAPAASADPAILAAALARGADQCAGWRRGATIMLEIETSGRAPAPTGPDAPSLRSPDDPLAWHAGALDPMAPRTSRRHRRIDLIAAGPGPSPTAGPGPSPIGEAPGPSTGRETGAPAGEFTVESLFRDSFQPDDGAQMVVHEYEVHGAMDPRSTRFTRLAATPRVLPWIECPEAVPSAAWLVGQPAHTARASVRRDFAGPPTCTHLNDTLCHLADLPALAVLLARHTGRPDPG